MGTIERFDEQLHRAEEVARIIGGLRISFSK
jgi:hypothetical protein